MEPLAITVIELVRLPPVNVKFSATDIALTLGQVITTVPLMVYPPDDRFVTVMLILNTLPLEFA